MAYKYSGLTTWVVKDWGISIDALARVRDMCASNTPETLREAGVVATMRLVPMDDRSLVDGTDGEMTFRLASDELIAPKRVVEPMTERVTRLAEDGHTVESIWNEVSLAPDLPMPESFAPYVPLNRENYGDLARQIVYEQSLRSRAGSALIRVEHLGVDGHYLVHAMTGNPQVTNRIEHALFSRGGLLANSIIGQPPAVFSEINPIVGERTMVTDLAKRFVVNYMAEDPDYHRRLIESTWVSRQARMTLNGEELVDAIPFLFEEVTDEGKPVWYVTRARFKMTSEYLTYTANITMSIDTGVGAISVSTHTRGELEESISNTAMALDTTMAALRSALQATDIVELVDHTTALDKIRERLSNQA